jgi:hypothetical protein
MAEERTQPEVQNRRASDGSSSNKVGQLKYHGQQKSRRAGSSSILGEFRGLLPAQKRRNHTIKHTLNMQNQKRLPTSPMYVFRERTQGTDRDWEQAAKNVPLGSRRNIPRHLTPDFHRTRNLRSSNSASYTPPNCIHTYTLRPFHVCVPLLPTAH